MLASRTTARAAVPSGKGGRRDTKKFLCVNTVSDKVVRHSLTISAMACVLKFYLDVNGLPIKGTLWRRNIAENLNRLSRAHERYRRQTKEVKK